MLHVEPPAWFFKKKSFEIVEDEPVRTININSPQHLRFVSNWVTNSKYNIITFLPKNLFEQFTRVANLYFLAISIVTFTPYSPVSPGSIASALAFVVLANMLKEGYEDFVKKIVPKIPKLTHNATLIIVEKNAKRQED